MPAETTPPHSSDDAWSPQAEAALLASQYDRLPLLLAINKGVGLVTVAVLAQEADFGLLIAWLLVLTAILAVRLWTWRSFRRAPLTPEHIARWSARLTLGAGLTGACWGVGGAAVYDPGSEVTVVYVPFTVAGMVSGSISGLSGHMPAFLAYAGAALGPFALRLAAEGDPTHAAMAALVVLYMGGVWYLGRGLATSIKTAVRLGVERSELVTRLRERGAQLEATIDGINQGVAVFEADGGLLAWNQRHRELHDYPDALYRPGTPLGAFVRDDLAGLGPGPLAGRLARWLDDLSGRAAMPIRYEKPGRGDGVLEVEHLPMPGGGFVSSAIDITERKRDEARMLSLAQHDALTGLPNRLLFDERFADATARAAAEGRRTGVVIADVDDFKQVNDSFGHRVGDQVLCELAARLREGVREGDTVARIGGDEFAIILPDLRSSAALAPLGAALAERLAAPLSIPGRSLHVRVSMGAAVHPTDGAEPGTVLEHADFAMYRAKEEGAGLLVHGAPVAAEIGARIVLERDLGAALANRSLELVFQPQVELRGGRLVGVEALLRWEHPVLGVLSPEAIVLAADRTGRTRELGAFVLSEACRALARTPGDVRVAVNLPAGQFADPDLPAEIDAILVTDGLPASRLELEVTETSDFPEDEHVARVFAALRARGIRIALDDFGTGHASFARLQRLPFDVLKIDRSIVRDLDTTVGQALVEAAVVLGHRLGCVVLAEGVENEATRGRLRELGCDLAQGHAVGAPLTAAALHDLLASPRGEGSGGRRHRA